MLLDGLAVELGCIILPRLGIALLSWGSNTRSNPFSLQNVRDSGEQTGRMYVQILNAWISLANRWKESP
jgi:hypothetical protein